MNSSFTESPLFLEPPHSHDPSNVSHIAALPISMLRQLPETVQDALWTLQESTSVVYASYLRLQALLDERFDRLLPLPGMPGSFSETSFFNYTNALLAERSYLLEDAHPDWKHKARHAGPLSNNSTSPYANLPVTYRGQKITVAQWFDRLHAAEALWVQFARDAALPDFESTVLEYHDRVSAAGALTDDSEAEAEAEAEGLGLGLGLVFSDDQGDGSSTAATTPSSEDSFYLGAGGGGRDAAAVATNSVPAVPGVVKPKKLVRVGHAYALGPERIAKPFMLQAL